MANYLNFISINDIKHEKFFEVIRDFKKGGLNPNIYPEFLKEVKKVEEGKNGNFSRFNLEDIPEKEIEIIFKELKRRAIEENKKCWHPEAGINTCNLDKKGRIKVSAAHSIQNNGVLSKISEKGHVVNWEFTPPNNGEMGKKLASIFWGMCNKHDQIFKPIEIEEYSGSERQNFLFAYRSALHSFHLKEETEYFMEYDPNPHPQHKVDIEETIRIFNECIKNEEYDRLITHQFELSRPYPIAVSSAFYLEYDFERNQLLHSDKRMEFMYLSIFPYQDKTKILFSFFKEDRELYEPVIEQLKKRDNLLNLDISIIVCSHSENVYFNPLYYQTFIKKHHKKLSRAFDLAQMQETPPYYLSNPSKIDLFRYSQKKKKAKKRR